MSDDAAPGDLTRRGRLWGDIQGPLVTLLVVLALALLDLSGNALPNPTTILLLASIYAGFRGGLGPALVSAGIAVAYSAIVLSDPGQPLTYTPENLFRVLFLAGAAPVTSLMVGLLRARLERATERLVKREQQLSRGLIASMQEGLAVFGPDARLRDVNPRLCEMTGFSRQELVGQGPPLPFWPPEEHEHLTSALRGALAGDAGEVDRIFMRRNGERFPVTVGRSPLRDESGAIVGSIATIRDVTERRRAEVALRESEERYRVVAETASDVFITIDEQSTILFANAAAEAVFGYRPSELLGQTLTILMPEDLRGRHRRSLARYLASGERHFSWQAIELRGLHRDGHEVPVEVSFGVVERPGGRIFTGIVRDITERKQAEERLRRSEEELRQAQKMEAVGRLAGGIAHDFNNVLTAIGGFAELLLADRRPGDRDADELREIGKAVARGSGLTRQLLAFSRRQLMQPMVLSLNHIVGGIEPMLRRVIGEDIRLVTRLQPDLYQVEADAGQIEQVILNLTLNARDAMPEGGTLMIETANAVFDDETAQEHLDVAPGRYALLAVSDTGIGMDAELQTHVFEPFFTTKEQGKGTGLGLATVYGIVTQTGGGVWVYSEPGHGSTFKIYLPEASGVAAEPLLAASVDVPRGTETILLVEDEEGVRRVACQILERLGYTVLEAADAPTALKIAADGSRTLDLLLTDVIMPGQRGRDLAEELSRDRPGLRVLYMSGYTDDAIIDRGVLDAEFVFLEKPFTADMIGRKVREALDR